MRAPKRVLRAMYRFQCEDELEESLNELTGLANCDGRTSFNHELEQDEHENDVIENWLNGGLRSMIFDYEFRLYLVYNGLEQSALIK